MIGLKFPRLFYGRKKRQVVIGTRADLCEFCLCICRHQQISFQSAQTVMFINAAFEEYDRESRCEICRTQFPSSTNKPFQKTNASAEAPISELIAETNPKVKEVAAEEVSKMVERADDLSVFQKNRITNFLRSHENEYHRRLRTFVPLIAIGSIQAMIVGLVMSVFVDLWLALAFVSSIYVLVSLAFFMILRKKAFGSFGGGAIRLLAITGMEIEALHNTVAEAGARFPKASAIICKQIEMAGQGNDISFVTGTDFVPLLNIKTPPSKPDKPNKPSTPSS